MRDFGEEGAEGSEVGEERGEDFVENENFGVGDFVCVTIFMFGVWFGGVCGCLKVSWLQLAPPGCIRHQTFGMQDPTLSHPLPLP